MDDSLASQFDSQALLEDSQHKLDKLTEQLRQTKMIHKIAKQMKKENIKELEKIIPKQGIDDLSSDPEIIKVKKEINNKKADDLRMMGNTLFKESRYSLAILKYSEAIDLVQDNKVNYLNRAIAYIKIKEYNKAISDCSKVIDLVMRQEGGYAKSKDSCCKAFLRRSWAQFKLGQTGLALADISEVLKIYPNDEEGLFLKEEFEKQKLLEERLNNDEFDKFSVEAQDGSRDSGQEDSGIVQYIKPEVEQQNIKPRKQVKDNENHYIFSGKVKSNEPLSYKDVIDKFVSNQPLDLFSVLQVMQLKTDESAAYFYDKKGIETLIQIIKMDEETLHDKQNLLASLPPLILQCYQEQNQIYQEQFLLQYNGVEIIMQKIIKLLHKAQNKDASAIFDTIEDYLECLNIMQGDKIRSIIQQNPFLQIQFYPEVFNRIICLWEEEFNLVATLFSFSANLCFDEGSCYRLQFYNGLESIINQINTIFKEIYLSVNTSNFILQINNFVANLLTEERVRKFFLNPQRKEYFQTFYGIIRMLHNYAGSDLEDLKISCLNILLNLTYCLNNQEIEYVNELQVIQIIQGFLHLAPNSVVGQQIMTINSRLEIKKNKRSQTQQQDLKRER